MTVSKTTMKKIVHRAFLRNIMGQTYLIYAFTGINHTRSCTGSRWLEARVLKKGYLIGRKSRAYGTILYIICGKITQF